MSRQQRLRIVHWFDLTRGARRWSQPLQAVMLHSRSQEGVPIPPEGLRLLGHQREALVPVRLLPVQTEVVEHDPQPLFVVRVLEPGHVARQRVHGRHQRKSRSGTRLTRFVPRRTRPDTVPAPPLRANLVRWRRFATLDHQVRIVWVGSFRLLCGGGGGCTSRGPTG